MIVLSILFASLAFAVAFWIAMPVSRNLNRWLSPAVLIMIVLSTAGLYMLGGQPEYSGQSHAQAAAERQAVDPASLPILARIERLRDIVRADEADAATWAMLGRELARVEREVEAVAAFQNSIRLEPSARTFSDFGQTLINLNEGEVTPDARRAFEEALTLDSELPEAAFFLGLSEYQAGNRSRASIVWTELLGRLEAGNPFRPVIANQAFNLLSQPDVDAQAVSQASETVITPQDRIAQMVAGLEARLNVDPSNLPDWLVLARVKRALNDEAGARQALERAAIETGDDAGNMVLLDTAFVALGFDVEEDPS